MMYVEKGHPVLNTFHSAPGLETTKNQKNNTNTKYVQICANTSEQLKVHNRHSMYHNNARPQILNHNAPVWCPKEYT
jgi:hypothetical protein